MENDDSLGDMKTPDQLEKDSAQILQDTAMVHACLNCENSGDWDAAAVAILTYAIEMIVKKEVEICYKK